METISFEQQLNILGGNSTGGYYSDGYWDYLNGEYVYIYDQGTIEEVVITLKGPGTGGSGAIGSSGTEIGEGFSANEIVGKMLTSMGATATHAEVNATILKLETKGFSMASKGFGIAGMDLMLLIGSKIPIGKTQVKLGLGLLQLVPVDGLL